MSNNKPGPKTGTRYNQGISCPYCDKNDIRSEPGLRGHVMFAHPAEYMASKQGQVAGDPEGFEPTPGVKAPPSPSNKSLRERLEKVKLEGELARYGIKPPQQAPDASEAAGLGPMTLGIQDELQSRAFGLAPQPNPQEALKQGLEVQKLIQEITGGNKTGDGFLEKLMGIVTFLGFGKDEVKEMLGRFLQPAPVSKDSFKIGNVSLPAGTVMSPELWKSIIAYQETENEIMYKKGKDAMLGDGLARLGAIISEGNFLGSFGRGNGSVSSRPKRESRSELDSLGELECSQCHAQVTIPAGIKVGEKFACSTDTCDASFTAIDDSKGKSKPDVPRFEVKEDLPVALNCRSCGQLLDISGYMIGSEIECAACGERTRIISEIESIRALPVEDSGE